MRISTWRPPPSWILLEIKSDGKSVSATWFWVLVQNFVQIHAKMAALWLLKQNFKMAAAAILDFPGCKFRLQSFLWDVMFSVCMKFDGNICNNGRVIAVNVNFKMAASAILDFVVCKFWWQNCSRTPFRISVSNLVQICAIAAELLRFRQKFKMAAVCHLGLLFATLDPTKTTWRQEACIQISWQSKQYFWSYRHLKISQIWLKTPILAPKIYVFGGFWSTNIVFHHQIFVTMTIGVDLTDTLKLADP